MTARLLLPAPGQTSLGRLDSVSCCDALVLCGALADASVDLIATDPPYNGVKDAEWDNQWATDADYIAWIGDLCQQWRRVLKPNGSLYVFASPRMAARVEVKIGESFNVLNNIVWMQPDASGAEKGVATLRTYALQTERIIFAEQWDIDRVFVNQVGSLHVQTMQPLRDYMLSALESSGVNKNKINEITGSYMADHWFNHPTQWTLPTVDMYKKIQSAYPDSFNRTYIELRREYEERRQDYEDLKRQYEDLRRAFNPSRFSPYTDVWDFGIVQAYAGKHPCEKPLALMKHIINVSSRAGAVVLDCFAGSGTTLDAARQLDRHYIGCDTDRHWVNYARRRLSHDYTLPMLLDTA